VERRAATSCGSRFTTRWDDGEARRRGHYGARQGVDLIEDELDLVGDDGVAAAAAVSATRYEASRRVDPRVTGSGEARANGRGVHNFIINIVTHMMFKQIA
jgi:hypothetical protein